MIIMISIYYLTIKPFIEFLKIHNDIHINTKITRLVNSFCINYHFHCFYFFFLDILVDIIMYLLDKIF